MKELSLNILDIAQNSITAKSTLINIEILEDKDIQGEERKQMIEALRKVLETLKPEEYEMIYNLYLAEEPKSERQYAEEKGIRYYNLFHELDALNLDGTTDFKDSQHLNYYGQEKFTRYMVEKGYLDY